MTPAAHCHELGPVRILTAWLPLPACVEACDTEANRHVWMDKAGGCTNWTKHSRVDKRRNGTRYLLPPARLYRAGVVRVVRPVLPRRPWFDAERPWWISYVTHTDGRRLDDDQHIGGIRDDLVEAGLVKDDGEAITSRLATKRTGPAGIFVIATQEGWGA